MIINGKTLLRCAPIKKMQLNKSIYKGTSYGLSEAGYDIRIKQTITFDQRGYRNIVIRTDSGSDPVEHAGRFILASSIEEFEMPPCLVGKVCDKSTWARQGLSVFNTVIEPGWKGFLTLELVYHGESELIIPAGSGIAQVIFEMCTRDVRYAGKYQNQENKPVEARS